MDICVSVTIPLSDLPARMLIGARFVDVAIVRGGMEQWNREGFAIAREPNTLHATRAAL